MFTQSIKTRTALILVLLGFGLLTAQAAGAGGTGSNDDLLKQIPGFRNDPWTWNRPFIPGHIVILEPMEPLVSSGPMTFRLAIFHRTDSVSLIVNISKLSRLEYHGAMTWEANIPKGDTVFYQLPVVIPANDTAGMEVTVTNSKGQASEAHCYVMTTANPPNVWYGDPRLSSKYRREHEPRQKFKHRVNDSLPEISDSVLFHDEEGNIIKGDSALKILKQLQQAMDPNMVWHQTSPGVVTLISFDSLAKLERKERRERELN